MKLKTRSVMYCNQMSDTVISKVEELARNTSKAKWMIVELLLESALNIKSDEMELIDFLGTNKNRAKIGKPNKKYKAV